MTRSKQVPYDIIGDIHGHAAKLRRLLRDLGYREHMSAWRHPERQAIFVGDLIDRGPEQVATVEIVRSMVDAGWARCIMGNHEFNAIAWSTPDAANPGEYLRPHGKPSNRNQHAAFLEEVEGKPLHGEIIDWFRSLPLYIEQRNIRIVHAYWHGPPIGWLRARLSPKGGLSADLVEEGPRIGTRAYMAIEAIARASKPDCPRAFRFMTRMGKKGMRLVSGGGTQISQPFAKRPSAPTNCCSGFRRPVPAGSAAAALCRPTGILRPLLVYGCAAGPGSERGMR